MIEEPEETIDQLEHKGEELDKDIEKTKDDWERKQESTDVPGAVPDESEDDSESEDDPESEDDSESESEGDG